MDRYEALYRFWASFGITAYEENSVPDLEEVVFPYITYEAAASPFDDEMSLTASIWTRSTSWQTADLLAEEVERRLRNGGAILPYTGGVLWVTPGAPLAQNMGDPEDDAIKRKLLNVQLHFY